MSNLYRLAHAAGWWIDVTPTLPVSDMVDAIRFYEAAGFDVERYDEGFAFVHFNDQSVCDLDLAASTNPTTNHAGCYVITNDVDDWHTRFVAAGLPVTAIEDMPWGCTSSPSPIPAATTCGSAATSPTTHRASVGGRGQDSCWWRLRRATSAWLLVLR